MTLVKIGDTWFNADQICYIEPAMMNPDNKWAVHMVNREIIPVEADLDMDEFPTWVI
jgi:hypothetical protein